LSKARQSYIIYLKADFYQLHTLQSSLEC